MIASILTPHCPSSVCTEHVVQRRAAGAVLSSGIEAPSRQLYRVGCIVRASSGRAAYARLGAEEEAVYGIVRWLQWQTERWERMAVIGHGNGTGNGDG